MERRRAPRWRWTALALLVMCVASEVTAVTARAQTAKGWQVRGEVGDAACNVEEVETANEQQLHEIYDMNNVDVFLKRFFVTVFPPAPTQEQLQNAPGLQYDSKFM